jgi:hypothetical protein
MNRNVPLERLKQACRELEAAIDVGRSFNVRDRDAIERAVAVETAIQTLRPVCVLLFRATRPGEVPPSDEDVLHAAMEAFDAPEGFFESLDEALHTDYL